MAKVPNGVETLPEISFAWGAYERYRRHMQTDGRRSEREVCAKNLDPIQPKPM